MRIHTLMLLYEVRMTNETKFSVPRLQVPGIFVTGTDTGVGKAYVAALICRALSDRGLRVGVYKPVASGCRIVDGDNVSDDAVALWNASNRKGDLHEVCPQRFLAPLAPHLAARAEGRQLDRQLLRSGLDRIRPQTDFLVVEGAGGLLSPLSDDESNADLATDFGLGLLVVAINRIGVINQVLLTLTAAQQYCKSLPIVGIVLNRPDLARDDPSLLTNAAEVACRTGVPVLADLSHGAQQVPARVLDYLCASEGP